MQQQRDLASTTGNRADKVRREAIRRLRKMAWEAKDGDFLGSESDLLRLLEVSRPTLRQALRLLEHEQLIRVKMGPLGGCYASRPEVESVVRSAATYLQVKDATLYEMLSVSGMLTSHAVVLAAACNNIEQRDALAAFIRKIDQLPSDPSAEEFRALETEFWAIIRSMASNRSLELFLQVAQRFIELNPESRVLATADPRIMRLRRRILLQIANAILSHDRLLARQLAEQQLDLFIGLLPAEALDKSVIGASVPSSAN